MRPLIPKSTNKIVSREGAEPIIPAYEVTRKHIQEQDTGQHNTTEAGCDN